MPMFLHIVINTYLILILLAILFVFSMEFFFVLEDIKEEEIKYSLVNGELIPAFLEERK